MTLLDFIPRPLDRRLTGIVQSAMQLGLEAWGASNHAWTVNTAEAHRRAAQAHIAAAHAADNPEFPRMAVCVVWQHQSCAAEHTIEALRYGGYFRNWGINYTDSTLECSPRNPHKCA